MESAALALMGQKMQAALLLYGDNAASAITDEAGGSGDFTAELAARILDGEELNSDGITGLLKQTIPDEDEEPLWKALDEEDEAFDDIESFDEFVDTWAMWQVLTCLLTFLSATSNCREKRSSSSAAPMNMGSRSPFLQREKG